MSKRTGSPVSTMQRRRSGTDTVANRLLTREGVYVGKSIAEHTIDLRAEIIIKDNAELSNVLEEAKAMDVVHDTGMERD